MSGWVRLSFKQRYGRGEGGGAYQRIYQVSRSEAGVALLKPHPCVVVTLTSDWLLTTLTGPVWSRVQFAFTPIGRTHRTVDEVVLVGHTRLGNALISVVVRALRKHTTTISCDEIHGSFRHYYARYSQHFSLGVHCPCRGGDDLGHNRLQFALVRLQYVDSPGFLWAAYRTTGVSWCPCWGLKSAEAFTQYLQQGSVQRQWGSPLLLIRHRR